jgi:hydroxymethylglutaryl-CoA synthase
MRAPDENAYTMAATAVLRLIQAYDIDPRRVGYFALGTESSTDNSTGAVIVKGMVNDALRALGAPPLARHCEVPEFKHACLGGVYAMKAAARYVALDGADKLAIVVCADIAEYARGSSGEPTQGAGAVAMLLESEPKLLAFDLTRAGSASDYRGPDFRKPFARYAGQTPSSHGQIRDFPIFNGKYSTSCYLDETLLAMADMFEKDTGVASTARWSKTAAAFLHRPYRRMAETGLAAAYLLALARGGSDGHTQLEALARAAGWNPLCSSANCRNGRNSTIRSATPRPIPIRPRSKRCARCARIRSIRRRCSTRCASAIAPCRSAAICTPRRCRAGSPQASKRQPPAVRR